MAINPAAITAYTQALQRATQPASGADGSGVHDFGALVTQALRQGEATGVALEAQALAPAAAGTGADMTAVVTAIAAAETTLEAVVAVRDKVVAAYQEILRMPI